MVFIVSVLHARQRIRKGDGDFRRFPGILWNQYSCSEVTVNYFPMTSSNFLTERAGKARSYRKIPNIVQWEYFFHHPANSRGKRRFFWRFLLEKLPFLRVPSGKIRIRRPESSFWVRVQIYILEKKTLVLSLVQWNTITQCKSSRTRKFASMNYISLRFTLDAWRYLLERLAVRFLKNSLSVLINCFVF